MWGWSMQIYSDGGEEDDDEEEKEEEDAGAGQADNVFQNRHGHLL